VFRWRNVKCEEKRVFGIPDVDRRMLLKHILKDVAKGLSWLR
jgi:hypothetical protein